MRQLITEAWAVGVDGDSIQAAAGEENWDRLKQLVHLKKNEAAEIVADEILTGTPGLSEDTVKQILALIEKNRKEQDMSIERIRQEVAELKTVHGAAVAAFQGIAEELRQALLLKSSDEELGKLADEIDATANSLADAIRVKTVADPAAPEPDNGIENAPDNEPPIGAVVDPVPEAKPEEPPANV